MTQNCFTLPSTNINRYGESSRKWTYERVGRFCDSNIVKHQKLVELLLSKLLSYLQVWKCQPKRLLLETAVREFWYMISVYIFTEGKSIYVVKNENEELTRTQVFWLYWCHGYLLVQNAVKHFRTASYYCKTNLFSQRQYIVFYHCFLYPKTECIM